MTMIINDNILSGELSLELLKNEYIRHHKTVMDIKNNMEMLSSIFLMCGLITPIILIVILVIKLIEGVTLVEFIDKIYNIKFILEVFFTPILLFCYYFYLRIRRSIFYNKLIDVVDNIFSVGQVICKSELHDRGGYSLNIKVLSNVVDSDIVFEQRDIKHIDRYYDFFIDVPEPFNGWGWYISLR